MPKRSKFNLGSYKLLTCDMGHLVPIQIKDVIPGDIFRGASQAFIRMQPMLAPIMHPIHVRIHHYFVPYRLIWDDFEEFITKNNEALFVPRIEFSENKTGSLADYFGVPPIAKDSNKKVEVSALPFRAYNMIWNEYYRDADLQAEIPVMTATPNLSSFDEETPVDLRSVCWNKDYFTLARPWEQKGEEVGIPVYTYPSAPSSYLVFKVHSSPRNTYKGCDKGIENTGSKRKWLPASSISFDMSLFVNSVANSVIFADTKLVYTGDALSCSNIPNTNGRNWEYQVESVTTSETEVPYNAQLTHTLLSDVTGQYRVEGTITFSVSTSSSGYVNVSDLRMAVAQQRLKERKAKYGSEYKDLLASYGIGYNDARMQRPEFISGGSTLLRISEVIQTAPSETLGVVGDMKGYGLGLAKSNGYKWRFPEHGLFMTLMSVLPSTMYSDGLERYLLKFRADDFYQREIATLIPSQEIYKQELFATATQDEVFGYIDRYDEYRFGYSTIAGDFRTTLDYWHMARKFTEAPALNGDFVRSSPTKRIFAEQTKHELLVMAQNMCRARRILRKRASSGAL